MVGREAFGAPGLAPNWTPSDKDIVTTALGKSRVWATLGQGFLTEIYWPSTREPQPRSGIGRGRPSRWNDLKRDCDYTLSVPDPFVPLPCVVHSGDGFQLTLECGPDPERDVMLVRYVLDGNEPLTVYPLLAPHLAVSGDDNVAWVGSGNELFAARGDRARCLTAYPGAQRAAAGYVGRSDGWQDFAEHGRMTWTFERAGPGNVALMAELADRQGVLALAFAARARGAQVLARASLADGFDRARDRFVERWRAWGDGLDFPQEDDGLSSAVPDAGKSSAVVLKVHDDRTYSGAVVASLSIPWGASRNDAGGYHLVWPRDAVQIGLATAALGEIRETRNVLAYLVATQQDDGSWAQNSFSDGTPFGSGLQLDEVALPVVLAARLAELGAPPVTDAAEMVRRAAAFLARTGPATEQDRWEEAAGVSPYTVGLAVTALVVAADVLDGADRDYALALADSWNECIEDWTYTAGGRFAGEVGVDAYYVRLAPAPGLGGLRGTVDIRNRPDVQLPATELVGMEFLYLVRLGLPRPDDPRIVDSLKVTEAKLARDLPTGRASLRYNEDGYGEAEDGSPFTDGTGRGHPWPLLVGARGHYELCAGGDPVPYLETMMAMSGRCGMLPEQVWDGPEIPERRLVPGRPTGSAMPLVWAHAEFVKLLLSRRQGRPLEQLDAVVERCRGQRPTVASRFWRPSAPFDRLPPGRGVTIEHPRPFVLHYGFDGWHDVDERGSALMGLGMHGVRFEAGEPETRGRLEFTWRYRDDGRDAWVGQNCAIGLE